jgi:phosphohistidine swiveling domain-containing protein
VGVHQATERLKDGQKIRVDGATGEIVVIPEQIFLFESSGAGIVE